MHLFDRNVNFLGGHGIVGGHIPIATGVGFAIKYRGGDQVCVCFFGEAAVNNGAFHEALNMAALWKLPVIYLIENNRYGMGTALERASAVNDIAERACSYDMPNEVVDGQRRDGRARGDAARRRARAPRAHPDAARGAHLPLHGSLDVRRGERHLSHARKSWTSTSSATRSRCCARRWRSSASGPRRRWRSSTTSSRRSCEDAWQFADASPEPPLEALYEDILVDTTSDTGAAAPVAG